ncbi:MAG: metallophosphoesterase [Bacteroidales bacterium]|nr:metallophosphoesterase [Candidatus Cryptobacteroides aphodequi]
MKTRIISIAAIAAAICLLAGCSSNRNELVILHLNDTHSHLDPLRDGSAGVLERAAYIDSVRRACGRNNVLLLHAGDAVQGSSYFPILGGDLETDLINALGYDCVTLGNHEFDNGLEELARRLSRTKCPVVCANYDFSTFEAGKYITPYTIIRKAGRKIGIIGLDCDLSRVVSREIVDRIPALNTLEVANKWAAYLKNEEKCDLVIALSHLGYANEPGVDDVELAAQTSDVDIVIGGHSHTYLEDATVITNATGRQVPVVQDGDWGRRVGKITVK